MVKNEEVGRSLIKRGPRSNIRSDRHTTTDSDDFSRLPLRSVTEESSLTEFFTIAELANSDFTAQKKPFRFISTNEISGVASLVARKQTNKVHETYQSLLKIPRRPKWNYKTTGEELQRMEKDEMLKWRRSLAILEQTDGVLMTPFEKNINFWRQLWRVVERSDMLVQIVDARQPLLYYCRDLEIYAHEVDSSKVCIVLVNKADLLTHEQRQAWFDYFSTVGIQAVFWSATLAAQADGSDMVDSESDSIESDVTKNNHSDSDSDSDHTIGGEEESANENEEVDVIESETEHSPTEDSEEEASNGLPNDSPEAEEKGNKVVKEEETQSQPIGKNTLSTVGADLLDTETLLDLLAHGIYPPMRVPLQPGQLTVGFVGYPNVGKSSTLNALMGSKRTSVSATPGRTKHYQTLYVRPDMVLCDCPGLVMPSFAHSKADLVAAGILSIDEMHDCLTPIGLICAQIPRSVLEFKYGINLSKPRPELADSVAPDVPPTPHELLAAHAFAHSFRTSKGNPHYDRSARLILKDYVTGRLLYGHPPPGIDATEYQFLGKAATTMHPCLAHANMTKQGVMQDEKPTDVDPALLTSFDQMAFNSQVKPKQHIRTRKHISSQKLDQSITGGDNSNEDAASNFSSASWITVASSVGGSSLLSGAESNVSDTTTGRKPWRQVSHSKVSDPIPTKREGKSHKKRQKLRRVYRYLDEHDNI